MEFELPVDDVKRGITAADQSAASGELAFNGIVIVLMLHLCKLVTENFQSFARKKKKHPSTQNSYSESQESLQS